MFDDSKKINDFNYTQLTNLNKSNGKIFGDLGA